MSFLAGNRCYADAICQISVYLVAELYMFFIGMFIAIRPSVSRTKSDVEARIL